MPSMHRRRDSGSALIVALLLMVVLGVVGVAIVNRTTREVDAVASKRHWDRELSCAEGARQMLISQFRTFGLNIAALKFQKVVGDQQYTTGHYNSFNITTVQPASGSPGGNVSFDATNRIGGPGSKGLGGKAYRFSVVCSDSAVATHQLEVEFLVNFGF
jgi:hypothetical protein